MNNIANRQVICEALLKAAEADRDVVVLCSDSRGSASLAPFAERFPQQFVEVGIAEQNLVSVAAGLARCGKRVIAASPASFLSTRSLEQIKVDVAYSNVNVKLIGISGGISYGALGMTHHSAQDVAAIGAIPGMRVYLPSDRHQTKALMERLLQDDAPAYVRVGRNPVEDVYTEEACPFQMDSPTLIREGKDVLLIACGELVGAAVGAAKVLEGEGMAPAVLDMYGVKPLAKQAVLAAARGVRAVFTLEEHSVLGGMGARVSQLVAEEDPKPVYNLGLPDAPVIAGSSREVFGYYGLTAEGIATTVIAKLMGGDSHAVHIGD